MDSVTQPNEPYRKTKQAPPARDILKKIHARVDNHDESRLIKNQIAPSSLEDVDERTRDVEPVTRSSSEHSRFRPTTRDVTSTSIRFGRPFTRVERHDGSRPTADGMGCSTRFG